MSEREFREALQKLCDAFAKDHRFPELDEARALLARPEPEPSDELERLQFLADRLSWPQPIRADLDAAAQTIEAFIQLRKSEPSPRITREEAELVLIEYFDKPTYENKLAVLSAMGVDHEPR